MNFGELVKRGLDREKRNIVMKDIKVFKRYTENDRHNHIVHRDEDYEVYLFLQGDVTFSIDGRLYSLEPNDLLLISNCELHQVIVNSDRPYERIYLNFDKEYFSLFSGEDYALEAPFNNEIGIAKKNNKIGHQIVLKYGLDKMMEKMYELSQEGTPQSRVLRIAQMLEILVTINLASQESSLQEESAGGKTGSNEKIDDIIQYISKHLDERITLDDLVKRFYISKYYLCHEFRRITGVSCQEYIRYKKIQKARMMLLAGQPLGDVWFQLGFENYSTFYRAFKQISEVSPSEFIKRKGKS